MVVVVSTSTHRTMYIKVSRNRPLCVGEDQTVIAETAFALLPQERTTCNGLSIYQETGDHKYSPFYDLPAMEEENILPANEKRSGLCYILCVPKNWSQRLILNFYCSEF